MDDVELFGLLLLLLALLLLDGELTRTFEHLDKADFVVALGVDALAFLIDAGNHATGQGQGTVAVVPCGSEHGKDLAGVLQPLLHVVGWSLEAS